LNELEIKAVMDANIAMELAETATAVGGKPTGGVAFTLTPEGTEGVKLPLLRAWEALETAEALLAPAGPQKVAPLRMARIAARLLGKESDGTVAAT
jgi:hypothetical protein